MGQAWHHPGLRLPTPWLPNGLAFWSADISVPYNVRTLGVPPTVKDVLMSRYAAVLRSSHPVVQGLPSQLLAHWQAGDGRVVDDTMIQLPRGMTTPPAGVTPLVGAVGPDNASSVEVTLGDGLYLINQLEITPNLDVDPAATRLFLNMLSYLEPQVLTIRPPLGLARGEAEIGIDLYTPRGWSLRSLRLRVDDEIWLETQAPVRVFPIDTFMLTDGDHQVTAEAEFETPSGSRMFRARGGIVVSNWRELHDDLEPPRAGWFGGLIKQLKTEEESAGWRYLQGESEWYFGDATRMAPGPAGVERLVWRMPRLQRAQVILYVPRDDAPTSPAVSPLLARPIASDGPLSAFGSNLCGRSGGSSSFQSGPMRPLDWSPASQTKPRSTGSASSLRAVRARAPSNSVKSPCGVSGKRTGHSLARWPSVR